MATPQDKLRKMKENKNDLGWGIGHSKSESIAKSNAKPSTLSPKELSAATKVISARRKVDQGKATSRAEFSVKQAAKKASAARVAAAVGGATKAKVSAKVTSKVAAKPAAKAKPVTDTLKATKMSKSESDFAKGQKLKAKITKKTGVYPNTAN